MNAHLISLLHEAEGWPQADQDELVAVAEAIRERRAGLVTLSVEERALLRERLQQAQAGEVASQAEAEAFFARCGLS